MRALVYAGPKKAEVREVEEPVKRKGTVKLDIQYCGVCGSDIGIFLGTHPRAKAPLIFGHEFLGIVAEDGKRFKKGDRVVPYPLLSCHHCLACRSGNEHVCNTLGLIGIDTDGGMCSTAYTEEDVLFKVPEGVSDKAAVLIEPLAVLVHGLHMSGFQAFDTAVVIGAGPIGILCGIVLKHAGASRVFISDLAEKRLKIAERLGMIPVNPEKENLEARVKEATGGEGCDVLFECSGAASAAMEMADIARVRGKLCIVSVHKKPHEVNLQKINFKEQSLVGTRVYTKEEFGQAVALTQELEKELEQLVTHIVPLEDSSRVFDMIADPECGTVKVVVDCRKG